MNMHVFDAVSVFHQGVNGDEGNKFSIEVRCGIWGPVQQGIAVKVKEV